MLTVLIVDEANLTRKTIVDELESLGFEVKTAEVADVAAEIIRAGGIDLVVTELELPYYGNRPTGFVPGMIVIEAARETETPVIISSFSLIAPRHVNTPIIVGMLLKPQSYSKVAKVIMETLTQPQPA
ncbi:MAG: hypothetical protein NTY30_02280 [Candidatus Berkelbacteria bacterium]|nr:hypothetical protein [Candidatus Berkelbacteria bacterium]